MLTIQSRLACSTRYMKNLLTAKDKAALKTYAEGLVAAVKVSAPETKKDAKVKAAKVRAEMAHTLFSHLNEAQRAEFASHLQVCATSGTVSPLLGLKV